MGKGSLSRGWSSWGVVLNTHPTSYRGYRKSTVILLLLLWAFKDCSKVNLLLLPKESNIIMSDGNELRKDLEISSALGEMSQLMIVMLPSYLCLLCLLCLLCSQPTGWTIRGSNSGRRRRFLSFSKCSDRLWVSGLQLTHWGRGHLNCLNARYRGF